MSGNLAATIERFADLHVLVLGEAMLDTYLEGTAERLCREAPVPVVQIRDRRDAPGGAANTAANVKRLGARASLVSVVGDDAEGARLRGVLDAAGVSCTHLFSRPRYATIAKNRIVAGSQLLVRFDQGANERLDRESERLVIDGLA